jgi:putative transposase
MRSRWRCAIAAVVQHRDQARASVFDYLEVFYNRQRRHSSLEYEAPLAFEASKKRLITVSTERG